MSVTSAVRKSNILVRQSTKARIIPNSINKNTAKVLVGSLAALYFSTLTTSLYSRQHTCLLNKTLNNIAHDFLNVYVKI